MPRKLWPFAAGICSLVVVASPLLAQAFLAVKVGPSGAVIFVNPQSDSATKGTLRAGQAVNVGEQPRNGYYQVTAGGGITGWVQEEALVIPKNAHVVSQPKSTTTPEVSDAPPKVFIGALGGLGIAGGGSSMGFGLDLDYKFDPSWGVGFYFNYLGVVGPSTTNPNGTVLMFAGEFNYYLPQLPGFWVGVKLGAGIASAGAVGAAAGTASTSVFGGGGGFGYDYAVLPMLSLGGEANVFQVGGNLTTTIVNLLGAFKYGF